MSTQKANKPNYYFICSGQKPELFTVRKFTGVDRISRLYHFKLLLVSENPDISHEEIINQPATFFMERYGSLYPYSGIVARFEYIEPTVDYSVYAVDIYPCLWKLSLTKQTRIFQKSSVPEIIKEILDQAKLNDYYTISVGSYPTLEYVVQYQESDLDFICRLMEGCGIWFFFKEKSLSEKDFPATSTREKLFITDKASLFENIPNDPEILFRPISGLVQNINDQEKENIYELSFARSMTSRDVLVKNYNYRTPEMNLSGKKSVTGGDLGSVYQYGGSFKNASDAEKEAELIAKQIGQKRIAAQGSATCRGFRAGNIFSLTGHVRKELNSKFVLTAVTHRADISQISAPMQTPDQWSTYRNRFLAIPKDISEGYKPPITTPVPRIPGVISAQIEANGSPYAMLDDMGRYKVRMRFDNSETQNYEASKFIRLAQPYSGQNYGIHFPSHETTEMLISHIDGDPNRPIGIGTVPHANAISPVRSINKEKGIIRTAGNNELVMDDTDKKQKITINTAAKNTILFDDENKKISIDTTGDTQKKSNNKMLLDDKNQAITVAAKKHILKLSYDSQDNSILLNTEGNHVIRIDDKNKQITIKTTGGNTIIMDDDKKNITIADPGDKNVVTLDGKNNGILLDSKGSITIKATNKISLKAAAITMEASDSIKATASGEMQLKGRDVKVQGSMNTEISAGMKATLSGSMLKAEGKTMADFTSSGKTTIQGTMVMIN